MRRALWAYLVTVGLVVSATGLGKLAHAHLSDPDLVMLYLLGIGVAAALFGRGAALLASVLSVAAYDFFFVHPFHTLTVSDQHYLLTFVMMFVVGLLTSTLTLRVRRQERERLQLAEEAEAATLRARTEEMRSSLLSAVSHDLRTPLAAITGAATTLRDRTGAVDPEQRVELLDTVCQEAERLERLVGNLLDMTRLESGALEVKREWVPLEEIVGSALGRLDAQLAGRPVQIELPLDLPLLSVDPLLVEQVLVNLVENAAKYSLPGASVEISARVEPGTMVVEVSDHGPGIPAGRESRVFEKFFRGLHAGVGGAGLGLAICRGIIEAHGGTILALNRPEGGALFRVRLPLVDGPPSLPPEADAEGAMNETA